MSDFKDYIRNTAALSAGGLAGYMTFKNTSTVLGSNLGVPILQQNKNLMMGNLQKIQQSNAFFSNFQAFRQGRAQMALEEMGLYTARAPSAVPLGDVINRGALNIDNEEVIGILHRARAQNWNKAIVQEWNAAVASAAASNRVLPITSMDPIGAISLQLTEMKHPSVLDVFDKFRGNIGALKGTKFIGMGPIHKNNIDIRLEQLTRELRMTSLSDITGLSDKVLEPTKLGGAPRFIRELDQMIPGRIAYDYLTGDGPGGVLSAYSIDERQQRKFLFDVPLTFSADGGPNRGLFRAGGNLQNVYAPGMFQVVDQNQLVGQPMTYGQFKVRQLKRAIEEFQSGASPHRTVAEALNAASMETEKLAMFTQPALGKDITFTPESILRGSDLSVVDAMGRPLDSKARMEFFKQHGKDLGLSVTSGHSRFTRADMATLYGGFADEIDPSRKPHQIFRDLVPSEGAIHSIKNSEFGEEAFDFLDSPLRREATRGQASMARFKTLYLPEKQILDLERMGLSIGDGELFLSHTATDRLQAQRFRRMRIHEVNSAISADMLSNNLKASFGPGAVLGRDVSGNLVTSNDIGGRIIRADPIFTTLNDESVLGADLLISDEINPTASSKVFGTLKGQARSISFSSIVEEGKNLSEGAQRKALSTLGISDWDELLNFEAIARLDEITKDSSKQLMQEYSGLLATMNDKYPEAVKGYAQKYFQEIQAAPDKSAAIRDIASRLGLAEGSPEWQRIFGDQHRIGISSLTLGPPKELTGAGKLGSFEPRLLTLMESGVFGDHTSSVANELVSRVAATNPEAVTLHSGLRTTLESMAGQVTPSEMEIYDPRNLTKTQREVLAREGGYLATGLDDIPYIYQPGYGSATAMRPRNLGEGGIIQGSSTADIFNNLQRDIRDLPADQLRAAINDKYATEIFQEYASGGKGQGSLLRGKMEGSRFLTAVSDIGDKWSLENNFKATAARLSQETGVPANRIVGIDPKQAMNMLSEIYPEGGEELTQAWERFSSQGHAGLVARHPFIGPYSAQPVLYVPHAGAGETMLIPEARVKSSAGILTEGILQGLAADKDADIPQAIFLGQGNEAALRSGLSSSGSSIGQALKTYEDHNIRMQLLKTKKIAQGASDLTRAEQYAAAAAKLGMTNEQVGILSKTLTEARDAVANSSLGGTDKVRALGLLEWVEQQPISAKHLSARQVLEGAFQRQMSDLRVGAGGSASLFADSIRDIVDASDNVTAGLLGKGARISIRGKERFIQGFDIDTTARQIIDAVSLHTGRTGADNLSRTQRFITPSKGARIGLKDIPDVLSANSLNRVTGKYAQGAQDALASINESLASAINRGGRYVKPALVGLAVAGGVGFALSGSPSSLEPPDMPSSSGAGSMSATDVEPNVARQVQGDPSISTRIQQAIFGTDEDTAEAQRIRAKIRANNVSSEQRERLTQLLNSRYPNQQMNINVNDARGSLGATRLSDMLNK